MRETIQFYRLCKGMQILHKLLNYVNMLTIISFLMILNVAWLHAAARLGTLESAAPWVLLLWRLSVPYFFIYAAYWQAKRVLALNHQGLTLQSECLRLCKRLLVPYFIWCILGSAWSIALHGVQLSGLASLRYLGLHPYLDPAYQPLWFLRNLFVLLLVETMIIAFYRRLTRSSARQLCLRPDLRSDDKDCLAAVCTKARRLIFLIYIVHSFFLSCLSLFDLKAPALVYALLAVLLSIVVLLPLKRFLPRVYSILFGGR